MLLISWNEKRKIGLRMLPVLDGKEKWEEIYEKRFY